MEIENRMVIEETENKKVYGVCEQCGEDIYYRRRNSNRSDKRKCNARVL